MQKIRKNAFLTFIALAATLFSALPFNALHHHEADCHDHSPNGFSLSESEADCALCDFQFLPVSFFGEISRVAEVFYFIDFQENAESVFLNRVSQSHFLRGPPTF